MDEITKRVLEFEAQPWKYSTEKELKIQSELEISPTEYYLLLSRALETPEALAHSPALVKRLKKLQESRVSLRTGAPS
ncbi:MAG: DUF3263 domain-containing protein [Micrococcaceae bacterium]